MSDTINFAAIPSVIPCTRDWRFFAGERELAHTPTCEDQHWPVVDLPHCWNADDMAPGQPMLDARVGCGWYRTHLTIDPQPDQRVLLRLDAATMEHELWVDGCYLGGSEGGFLASRYDITDALRWGETDSEGRHTIAIRVSNAPRPGMMPPEVIDWERFGGLIRPVWLEYRALAYFDMSGIRIRSTFPDDQHAEVTLTSTLTDYGPDGRTLRLRHRIYDPDGQQVAEVGHDLTTRHSRSVESTQACRIAAPQRWHPDHPHLYRIVSEVCDGEAVLDTVEQCIGLRTVAWDAKRGFLLNGQPLKLFGVNAHQDYRGCGHALPERFHRQDIADMKAAGLNCLRGAHYPRHEAALQACDELGILVIEELPFWHGSCRTYHGEPLIRHAAEQSRELVRQHGNHPCIILWNAVNEIMHMPGHLEPHLPPEMRQTKHQLSQQEWPFARRVIQALVGGFQEIDDRAVSVVLGGTWTRNCEAEIPALADAIGCNSGTFHWGYGNDDWAVATVRQQYPQTPIYLSEGILLKEAVTRADWVHETSAWTTFADIWNDIFSWDWFCGGTMWVWADYSAKGTYRTRGMVDYRRLPLESFYFFRSQGVPELTCHICGHWSDDGSAEHEREVAVFHNGERVSLELDGETIATGSPDHERWPHLPHPPTVFRIPFRSGTLKAVVTRGDEQARDQRVSEGAPAAISVEAEGEELTADGSDVRFIRATVLDAAGHRCYLVQDRIHVQVDGAASLCGPANIELSGGLARWAVRSTGEAGTYTIVAHSLNLRGDYSSRGTRLLNEYPESRTP